MTDWVGRCIEGSTQFSGARNVDFIAISGLRKCIERSTQCRPRRIQRSTQCIGMAVYAISRNVYECHILVGLSCIQRSTQYLGMSVYAIYRNV